MIGNFRSGYVAIIGVPNVGKSTLMNSLIGQKISAVTNKPQTTRHKILGIISTEQYQIIFLDTPGLLKPKYLLHEAMLSSAHSALNDADIVLFIIDSTNPKIGKDFTDADYLRWLNKIKKPVFLLINKIDLIKKQNILPIIAFYSEKYPFKEIFPISALNLQGTEDLMKALVSELPENPP
ncbi:MAG: GTPase Era, partial [Bacteroidota bacterium]|nr:GTPase Era [Bacteroidota bacterium]